MNALMKKCLILMIFHPQMSLKEEEVVVNSFFKFCKKFKKDGETAERFRFTNSARRIRSDITSSDCFVDSSLLLIF